MPRVKSCSAEMGIEIKDAYDITVCTAAGAPKPIAVTFTCDDTSEMFCRGFETFTDPDGYIGIHKAAMAAGWLERHAPQGRIWLCPRCSGK